jgi:hypothetical protein
MTDFQQYGYIGCFNEFNVAADTLEITNLVVQNVTLSSVVPNAVLVTNASQQLDDVVLTPNKFLMGSTASVPIAGSILGTSNQVIVTGNPTDLTLSLPQSIGITSVPEFASVQVDNCIWNQLVRTDASNNLSSFTLAVNGAIPIGSNAGSGPVAATISHGTSITITNGQGSISVDTIQPITSADTPTFAGMTLNGNLVMGSNLVDGVDVSAFKTDYDSKVNQDVKSSASPSFAGMTLNGDLVMGSNLVDGVDISAFKTDYDSKINQSVKSSASPSFAGLTVGTASGSVISTAGVLSTVAMTDGQLIIGSTSGSPAAASLTAGTGITITPSSHGILIDATALGGLSAKKAVYTDASSNLATVALTDGQLLIGSTGNIPAVGTITGTANRVTVTTGSGTIALSGPQDLGITSGPQFSRLNLVDPTNQITFDSATFDTIITCPVPAANRTLTIPDAGAVTDTFVLRDMAQTLTNKTLTGNTAVSLKSGAAVITLPTTTSTLATIALSETLTNKTLTSPIISTIVNTGTLTLPLAPIVSCG